MGQTWSAGGSIGIAESGGKKWRKKIGRTVVAVHSTVIVPVTRSIIVSPQWMVAERAGSDVAVEGCCCPHKQKRRLPEGKRRFVWSWHV